VHTGVWGGEPERKRSLGKPKRRREDNIKMDLQEVGMDWIDLAQDRDRWRSSCKSGDETSGFMKLGIS